MPITSLWCPCTGAEVPLDHYTSGACAKTPMPLPWIAGILANTVGDTRHKAMQMSASRLSGCPRSDAIHDLLPVPRVDLRRFNSIAHGWAGHFWMKHYSPDGMLAEVSVLGTLFRGTPYELEVSGHADVIRPRPLDPLMLLLEDYKFTSETNQRYLSEVTEKAEWNVQLSTYRALAPQHDVREVAIWSGASVTRKGVPWIRIPARILTEEEILEAKPFEGEATVADHILDFKALRDRLSQGMPVEEAINAMPMRGEMQWRRKDGASKCDYCTQSDVCAGLARKGMEVGEI
jgi:hypothetical protein